MIIFALTTPVYPMSIWLDSIYEIAGLLLGLTGFLMLAQKKFENGIYLVIFFLPLYLLKIRFFFVPFNVLEIMIGLLFFLWLVTKRYRAAKLSEISRFSLPALLVLNGRYCQLCFRRILRSQPEF